MSKVAKDPIAKLPSSSAVKMREALRDIMILIQYAEGVPQKELATMYNVNKSTIHRIIKRNQGFLAFLEKYQ